MDSSVDGLVAETPKHGHAALRSSSRATTPRASRAEDEAGRSAEVLMARRGNSKSSLPSSQTASRDTSTVSLRAASSFGSSGHVVGFASARGGAAGGAHRIAPAPAAAADAASSSSAAAAAAGSSPAASFTLGGLPGPPPPTRHQSKYNSPRDADDDSGATPLAAAVAAAICAEEAFTAAMAAELEEQEASAGAASAPPATREARASADTSGASNPHRPRPSGLSTSFSFSTEAPWQSAELVAPSPRPIRAHGRMAAEAASSALASAAAGPPSVEMRSAEIVPLSSLTLPPPTPLLPPRSSQRSTSVSSHRLLISRDLRDGGSDSGSPRAMWERGSRDAPRNSREARSSVEAGDSREEERLGGMLGDDRYLSDDDDVVETRSVFTTHPRSCPGSDPGSDHELNMEDHVITVDARPASPLPPDAYSAADDKHSHLADFRPISRRDDAGVPIRPEGVRPRYMDEIPAVDNSPVGFIALERVHTLPDATATTGRHASRRPTDEELAALPPGASPRAGSIEEGSWPEESLINWAAPSVLGGESRWGGESPHPWEGGSSSPQPRRFSLTSIASSHPFGEGRSNEGSPQGARADARRFSLTSVASYADADGSASVSMGRAGGLCKSQAATSASAWVAAGGAQREGIREELESELLSANTLVAVGGGGLLNRGRVSPEPLARHAAVAGVVRCRLGNTGLILPHTPAPVSRTPSAHLRPQALAPSPKPQARSPKPEVQSPFT